MWWFTAGGNAVQHMEMQYFVAHNVFEMNLCVIIDEI